MNKWTLGLAAVGLVTLPAALQAEEKMSPLMTAVTPTSVSGYVNTSIHWNPGTGNGHVPAYGLNFNPDGSGKKSDGFNLDVVNLKIEKPLDEGQWAAGYTAELLFGPDANAYATQSSGTAADFGIKQAYVALRAPVGNGLDFKVGVWDTTTGYEVFNAGNNPNYTRSYGWTMEATTHTGVLMSYQLCKFASASVGIANTHGPVINARARTESHKTYIASTTLTAPENWGFLAGSALYGTVMNGFNSGTAAGGVNQTSYYLGATVNTPLKWLKVGAAYDHLATTDHTYGPGADTSWYGNAYGLYASMTVNEKLSVHLRGEYANTDTSLLGSGADLPGGNSAVIAGTATVQYDLWKNVISRLELRWDHLAGDNDQTGFGGKASPGGAPTPGSLRNYYTIALNLIYKF